MHTDLSKKLVPFTVFFIVANPATFKFVRGLAGNWVASAEGLPTTAGLLLHALVFVVLAHFVWKLVYGSKKSGFGGTASLSHGTLDGQGNYTSSNARGIQGQSMHPADFGGDDDGSACQ